MKHGKTRNMAKQIKILLIAVSAVSVGYLAYKQFIVSPKAMGLYLIEKGHYNSGLSNLLSLDAKFVKAWYDAAKKGQTTFSIEGNTYSVTGGRRIKN